LAQKVIERVTAAGLPSGLIPDTVTSVTVLPYVDSENALRSAVLEFMDTVRRVEHAIAAGRRGEGVPEELDVATLGEISEEEWRAYWPSAAVGDADDEPQAVGPAPEESGDTEPAPDRIPEPTPADVPEPGPADVPEPSPVDVPEPSPEDVSAEDAEPGEEAEEADEGKTAAAKFTA
jgi:XTP/dITP diphosphohydrolase